MAEVTGKVTDFKLLSMAGKHLQVVLKPSGPVTTPTRWLATDEIVIDPALDGSWSQELSSTDTWMPEGWYVPCLRWLDPVRGYTDYDFTQWHLYVPAEGGEFTKLVDTQGANPLLVVVGPDPSAVPLRPNVFFLNTANGGSKLYRTKAI